MGVPSDSVWAGVTLTFYDIKKYPGDNPEPPNGVHFLYLDGLMIFHKLTADFDMQFYFPDTAPHQGWSAVHVDSLFGLGAHVFEGYTEPNSGKDIYRIDNLYQSEFLSYYGGYCIVTPIYETDLPEDLASFITAAGLDGGSRKFTEAMGAGAGSRGIRVARVSDHTCVYMRQAPVLAIP